MAKKILYAEDMLSNRKYLYYKFKQDGYDCDTAENGEEALRLIREKQYDLIILDLHMPKMNGDEVMETAKKDGLSTPVFCLTSDDRQEKAMLAKGFAGICIKPANNENFFNRIYAVLEETNE